MRGIMQKHTLAVSGIVGALLALVTADRTMALLRGWQTRGMPHAVKLTYRAVEAARSLAFFVLIVLNVVLIFSAKAGGVRRGS